MNLREYLHVKLMEECNEISMDCSKSIIFGAESSNPHIEGDLANKQKIIDELNDLLGVVELLVDCKELPHDWQSRTKILAKKNKVKRLMEYSIKAGCLNEEI